MATEAPRTAVVHQADRSRYELVVDGEVAGVAGYRETASGVRVFMHTVIHEQFEGRGLASVLVRGAIADTVESGASFAATCPYVLHWLTKNHDFDDSLVEPPPD